MKTSFLLSGLLLLTPAALVAGNDKNCGCECCSGKDACCCATPTATEPAKPAPVETAKTHPLKGVITGIMTEKTALLVKHEEVPGVMRAMTMLFKVDPAVLQQVKQGDAIRAQMSRREDGWWLTDVEVVK